MSATQFSTVSTLSITFRLCTHSCPTGETTLYGSRTCGWATLYGPRASCHYGFGNPWKASGNQQKASERFQTRWSRAMFWGFTWWTGMLHPWLFELQWANAVFWFILTEFLWFPVWWGCSWCCEARGRVPSATTLGPSSTVQNWSFNRSNRIRSCSNHNSHWQHNWGAGLQWVKGWECKGQKIKKDGSWSIWVDLLFSSLGLALELCTLLAVKQ